MIIQTIQTIDHLIDNATTNIDRLFRNIVAVILLSPLWGSIIFIGYLLWAAHPLLLVIWVAGWWNNELDRKADKKRQSELDRMYG